MTSLRLGDIAPDFTQNTTVNFPILADADKTVSNLYDMIHPNASTTATVRSVFIGDPKRPSAPRLLTRPARDATLTRSCA